MSFLIPDPDALLEEKPNLWPSKHTERGAKAEAVLSGTINSDERGAVPCTHALSLYSDDAMRAKSQNTST